jgi:putative glycosyltransferase (TIGR04372 family)
MKLKKYNFYNYCKKFKVIVYIYYKLLYFIYYFLTIIFIAINKDYGIYFIRRSLSYGVDPLFFKKRLLYIVNNISKTSDDIFILVAILNALGYVFIARRILLNHSTAFRDSRCRIFKSELFSAFGHIALLDIYIKAKILGYQVYEKDYIEKDVTDFVTNLAGNFFDLNNSVSSKEAFYENYNYTFINKKFILFDEFTSKIQKKYESRFSSTINYPFKHKNNINSGTLNKNFDWYVCLHTRESADRLTDLRNAPIQGYYKAVKNILLKGGGVFRINEAGNIYLVLHTNGNIVEHLYSKDLDSQLIIISGCRFFIGTGSGPINVSSHVLGRPVLSTNWAPLGCRLSWSNQVILPKKYVKKDRNNVMFYSQRLRGGFSRIESSLRLNELGYNSINNNEDEIEAAVNEMLEATEGDSFNGQIFLKSDLQKKFYNLITNEKQLMPIYISDYFSKKHYKEIN